MTTIEENKKLVQEFPFLLPRNNFTSNIIDDYDYSFTELDNMPEGWKKAFGIKMCKEIKEDLESFNYLDQYRIVQIKEKWGALRWYDNGVPVEYEDEIEEFKIPINTVVPIHHSPGYWIYYDHSDDKFRYYIKKKIKRTSQVPKIISKYEKISAHTCVSCGNKAEYESTGYILPYCKTCAQAFLDRENKYDLDHYKNFKARTFDKSFNKISSYETLSSEELREIFEENFTV